MNSKFWDEKAEDYGDIFESQTLSTGVSIFNFLDLQNAKNILEVGCGTGELSLFCLKAIRGPSTLTSVDYSEKMIEVSNKKKKASLGLNPNIKHEFVVGNAENLDFVKDESIDAYVSAMCIHMVDPAKMLSEIKRVLIRGGDFALSIPAGLQFNGLMRLYVSRLVEAGAVFSGGAKPVLSSKEELVAAVEKSSLEVDFAWTDKIVFRIKDDKDLEAVLKSSMFKGAYESLSEENRKKVLENVLKDYDEQYRKTKIPIEVQTYIVKGHKSQ